MILYHSIFLILFAGYFSLTNAFDCSGLSDDNITTINVTEVDLAGTVIAEFTNSTTLPIYNVIFGGAVSTYLKSYFRTVTDEANNKYVVQLDRILDLEYLQIELGIQITSLEGIKLWLHTTCRNQEMEWRSWRLEINVLPVNEFTPAIIGGPFEVSVSEATNVGEEIFSLAGRASDIDVGTNVLTASIAPYMITAFDGSGYVQIDQHIWGSISLVKSLDYESFRRTGRTYFFINVTVSDGMFMSATSINVSVSDYNDQGPEFVYPDCQSPCLKVNYTVYTNESYTGLLKVSPRGIMARDLDTLNAPINYSLLTADGSEYFSIDSTTGMMSKIAPLVNDTFGYTITLQVVATEVTESSHYVKSNVTVFIVERKPLRADYSSPLQLS